MYYKFNNKENFKAWSLSAGIILYLFIVLLLAGASCSSPSSRRDAVPIERFVILTIVQVEDYRSDGKASVLRLERVSDHTVLVKTMRWETYYQVGDTVLMKWYKEYGTI